MIEIGVSSIYKRMYDVKVREAALNEPLSLVQDRLQIDRLAHYCREGLITVDEAKAALVERLVRHGSSEFFQAYRVEWAHSTLVKERVALAIRWTKGSNEGTPMEEIEKIEEAQPKPKQLYHEPRITTRDQITGAHPSDWAYKR